MSKPSYDELVDLIRKIYKTSRVESALNLDWANYPIEVFDEVIDMATMLEFPSEEAEGGELE